TRSWVRIAGDEARRVAVVTGAGRACSAGGDMDMVERNATDPRRLANTVREASDIVYNMINLDKPVISAINGVAVGAGLVVAMMADISIMSETARFTDGHTKLGVVAGDHAAILWPLLCGMAKAKYYLLTSDFIDGKEAERIGLVSLCVPAAELLPKAFEVADKLAQGSQQAIRWTKKSLNNWLRMAGPIFDQSIALEMLTFMEEDVREGIKAHEASQLGSVGTLRESDWMVPSFRETAAMLWRGWPIEKLLMTFAGQLEGCQPSPEQHDLPITIPVGTQLPHAVGLAYAAQYRGDDVVVMAYFGDGATSEGDFHEALNFAGVWHVPVVFVCQTNQWASSGPVETQAHP